MDPLSDFLNTLKMASRERLASFSFPASRFISSVADALQTKGFIESSKKIKKGYGLEVHLPVHPSAQSAQTGLRAKGRTVSGVKRISKLSKRIYRHAKDLRPVRSGQGIAFISTPKGILTDTEARKQSEGGEVLFEIW